MLPYLLTERSFSYNNQKILPKQLNSSRLLDARACCKTRWKIVMVEFPINRFQGYNLIGFVAATVMALLVFWTSRWVSRPDAVAVARPRECCQPWLICLLFFCMWWQYYCTQHATVCPRSVLHGFRFLDMHREYKQCVQYYEMLMCSLTLDITTES